MADQLEENMESKKFKKIKVRPPPLLPSAAFRRVQLDRLSRVQEFEFGILKIRTPHLSSSNIVNYRKTWVSRATTCMVSVLKTTSSRSFSTRAESERASDTTLLVYCHFEIASCYSLLLCERFLFSCHECKEELIG